MVRLVVDWVMIPLAALLTGSAVWLFLILWFEPHPITSFERMHWPSEVRAGDAVMIQSKVYRSKSKCGSLVTRRWLNDIGIEMAPPEYQTVPPRPRGWETFTARVFVPGTLKPGHVILRNSVNFKCNVVQRWFGGVDLPLPDLPLTVIE